MVPACNVGWPIENIHLTKVWVVFCRDANITSSKFSKIVCLLFNIWAPENDEYMTEKTQRFKIASWKRCLNTVFWQATAPPERGFEGEFQHMCVGIFCELLCKQWFKFDLSTFKEVFKHAILTSNSHPEWGFEGEFQHMCPWILYESLCKNND